MRKAHFQPCGGSTQVYEEESVLLKSDLGRLCALVALAVVFGLLPLTAGPTLLHVLSEIGIFALAALGLNLVLGVTGQISLVHGGLFGVGAYCGAILADRAGLPFFLVLPAAGIAAAAVGTAIALPALRLKEIYLPLATLAGQVLIGYLFARWEWAAAPTTAPGGGMHNPLTLYFAVFILNAAVVWGVLNLMRSKHGRALLAIRADERISEERGIPVVRYKTLSFSIGGFCAGLAGALYACLATGLAPGTFGLWSSAEFIAVVVVGGLGSIKGSFFGAIFFVLLQAVAGNLAPAGPAGAFALKETLFGLSLLFAILFAPKGLAGGWDRIRTAWKRWPL